MKKNERLQALRILVKLIEDKIPLSHLMQASQDLSPFSKELCFGFCRQYYRLEIIADALLDKRPKAIEVWVVILLGLYQLYFMKKPDYAVVKETVALLESIKKTWAKGLVNAVLRTFCREQEALITKLQANASYEYGHPQWFVKQLQKDWPNDWQQILRANDEHAPLSLRINQQRVSREDYLSRLEQAEIKAMPLQYARMGIQLETPCDVHELPGFSEGDLSVQDESAQLAISLLDLQPGLRVLDACCAPGGKTCHILEEESQLESCLAIDLDERRLKRVTENLKRLHLKADIQQADGLKPADWWSGKSFDRILLDAPCSATGVIRRHPDIKMLRTSDEVNDIVSLQKQLLESLWPLLAPGGLMVYATCSIFSKENEAQIASFIAAQPDCEWLEEIKPWGHCTGHGWQILPGDFNSDGFFYSVLRKKRI